MDLVDIQSVGIHSTRDMSSEEYQGGPWNFRAEVDRREELNYYRETRNKTIIPKEVLYNSTYRKKK